MTQSGYFSIAIFRLRIFFLASHFANLSCLKMEVSEQIIGFIFPEST